MISVIISTYNSEKYLGECLDSVLKSEGVRGYYAPRSARHHPRAFEVIVVDAGTPITNQFSISQFKKIKLKRLDKNVGLTVSNNIGARMAKGEYLLFLDVDTKIDKKALFELVKFFEKNPDCGAVQGKLVDRNGSVETRGHFLSRGGFPWELLKASPCVRRGTPCEIFGARGACLGIRREVFEKIGGFDEDFFMHNEETDLCWRVWLLGYRIYYLPRAVCLHYGKSHYSVKSSASLRVLGARIPAFGGTRCAPKTLEAPPQDLTPHNRLFYEGAKNQITMIIKNADLAMMVWMLPLNILGWMVVGLKSPWVYRGIGRAFLNLGKTIGKRRKVLRVKNNEANKIIFGEIGFGELLRKGFLWIKSL